MNFSLSKNPLYAKEGDPPYIAHTRASGVMTKEQVIQRLAHGSTLTEADINAVLSGLEKVLVDYIVMGLRIELGFITLSHSIKGGFDSPEDFFRKERNWININANVNNSFANAVNQTAKPTRVMPESKAPRPLIITKVLGNMAAPEFQAGNLVKISGLKLGFDNTDTESGVFLKPQTGNIIRVSEYAKAGDTSILCKLPDNVEPGKNKLEIRSRGTDGELNIGVLGDPVMIAA
jgi:hypothetical protein